ncbi:MAG: DNA mismatch repair endonuclease MutL [Phycisphaerae bacterium]
MNVANSNSEAADKQHDIHVLPDALINKIAAGEVVERPASVVKELLDNAVDAGAARLAITIENGGRTLIRVTDDGSGIAPEQLPLALARHATSKIQTIEDLFAIRTLGFRGEALASIAGVSHTTIITRRPQDQQAVRVVAQESVVDTPVPCAAPVGTTIEVRDLFYCVPARRKFLRGDSTEFGHISEIILRTALAHPEIAITLSHNGRSSLNLPGTTNAEGRLISALNKDLQGQLIALDHSEPGIAVTGFVGAPATARATAHYQYLFLNGRYIRDRSIFHAVKESFRGLIEPQAQPVAVIFMRMPATAFDVNVHPQKIEVRFREPNLAYHAVLAAIRERLLAADLTPRMRMPDAPTPEAVGKFMTNQTEERRQVIAEFFRDPQPLQQSLDLPLPPNSPHSTGNKVDITDMQQSHAPAAQESAPSDTTPRRAAFAAPSGFPAAVTPRFMQFHNAFIVVEDGDDLLVIDQHALHERVIYESLLAHVRAGTLAGQRLLLPVVVSVSAQQLAELERVRPLLAALGIEITQFDATSVAVQSLPSLLSRLNTINFVRELLDKVAEESARITDEELLHNVLDMAACKAAVKAGDPLANEEIAALLARRQEVERSSNCPHGRPTTIRLERRDLEKQFKRR